MTASNEYGRISQQIIEFVHGQSCLLDDGSQGSFSHLGMIRDNDAAMGVNYLP
jgi:hypothetical protein